MNDLVENAHEGFRKSARQSHENGSFESNVSNRYSELIQPKGFGERMLASVSMNINGLVLKYELKKFLR